MKRGYSGPGSMATPCDLCAGPTLILSDGSIWCPAEDPHFGGHFVHRATTSAPIKKTSRASLRAKPEPTPSLSYDDFVRSDD